MSNAKRLIPFVTMALMVVWATGCSGINASHSVSPASFFLPGLLKNEVKPVVGDPMASPAEQIALLTVPSH